MNSGTFSAEQRKQLIDRYYTLRRNLSGPNLQSLTVEQRQAMAQERDATMAEYAERLPFVTVSRCPFCIEPVEYPMDAVGLDGPWWFKGPLADYPEPKACEHFRVLLGAIDLHLNRPLECTMIPEVLPGPGVPYVVPRMLEKIPQMKAVISRITLLPDYPSYPIAYFSEKPVHGSLLHQPWGRQAYQVKNEEGKYEGWFSANDKLDFELQPWLDKGLVFWINPGDPSFTLQSRPPCPYVGLPGVRAPQKIIRGKLETMPLPTGEKFQPFE